jgi:transglutaminase-like putative cysteine protease
MRVIKRLVLIILCLLLITAADYRRFQESLGRADTLTTTYDPERYVRFTADGNMIRAEGYFRDAVVDNFYISTATLRGMTNEFSFSSNGNAGGSFTASFGGIPAESHARAVITFTDGAVMAYRVEYDNGWFFGDNGLAERTAAVVENYYTIPPDISEYYVSATRDPDELAETRALLREIVAEVTEGIEGAYHRARALNDWVARNIVYDRDARDSDVNEESISIASTLRLRRSVCIGIANTYIALLETAGIKAVNIKGGITSQAEGVPYEKLRDNTVVHEWAAFWYEAESRWVYADPTWDRQGNFAGGEYEFMPAVHKHFDITPLALSFDHRGDKAELRHFMPVHEPAGDDAPDTPEVPAIPEAPEAVSVPAVPPVYPREEDNSLLFVVIGVMTLTAAGLIYVIFKLRR